METKSGSVIDEAIELLSSQGDAECESLGHHDQLLPSIEKLKEVVELIRSIIFPGYFGGPVLRQQSRHHFLGVRIEKLYGLLAGQILSVQHFDTGNCDSTNATEKSGRNREPVHRAPA